MCHWVIRNKRISSHYLVFKQRIFIVHKNGDSNFTIPLTIVRMGTIGTDVRTAISETN